MTVEAFGYIFGLIIVLAVVVTLAINKKDKNARKEINGGGPDMGGVPDDNRGTGTGSPEVPKHNP